MSEPTFKAEISQNQHSRYVVSVKRDFGPGYVAREVAWDVTYTLKGARKKAAKMLAKARFAQQEPKILEEIK